MKVQNFGSLPTGEQIYKYTCEGKNCSISVLNFGAILQNFTVFGRSIVGGFDTLDGYLKDDSHQGGIIGRVANRIKDARFEMDGRTYSLTKNDGDNCLHGGVGFDRRVWSVCEHTDNKIMLEYTSASGEEGFPNSLKVRVCYTLLDSGFAIEYSAVPDGKTPISLTNHAYFNLDGFGGTIEEHKVQVFADTYTAVGEDLIPTGERPPVAGTVFDLREPAVIGERLSADFIGYDHNFNLKPTKSGNILGKSLSLAATVENRDLRLLAYTDKPALQLYIGNFLGNGPAFSGGIPQIYHGAMCLETQTEPNSVTRGEGFYESSEEYTHFTAYTVEKI